MMHDLWQLSWDLRGSFQIHGAAEDQLGAVIRTGLMKNCPTAPPHIISAGSVRSDSVGKPKLCKYNTYSLFVHKLSAADLNRERVELCCRLAVFLRSLSSAQHTHMLVQDVSNTHTLCSHSTELKKRSFLHILLPEKP